MKKMLSLALCVITLMGLMAVPASAEGLVSGAAGGSPTDASASMASVDDNFKTFCEYRAKMTGCKDIIDYENLTIEYADKDGNPFGGKSVWDRTTREITHYDADGNEVFAIDAYVENPFAKIEYVATPSAQTVLVDGKAVEFAMYALNDGAVNYIRVRDLAVVLNGTAAQFNVGWNIYVTLTSKTPYDGATDKAPFSTPMAYTDYNTYYTEPIYVDGKAVNLKGILIDYAGGGFIYYKLRDLAQALNFNVGWSADKGIYVETDKPYDPAN